MCSHIPEFQTENFPSIWLISYSGKLGSKDCVVKRYEMIMRSTFCSVTVLGLISQNTVKVMNTKTAVIVIRPHSRHVEFILLLHVFIIVIVNFEGIVYNN